MRNSNSFARAAFTLAAFFALSGGVPAVAQNADSRAAVWAQDKSDIPADPAVRFGVLPNGMRYAIMKNDTPANEVSLRMRIAAGSFQEADAQQGLAHYLEHMAFRGSTHVHDGDVEKTLERIGLRMGADTNAATGQTQTTFRFDLPKPDVQTVDTGLMLMREIASELVLDPQAFDKERGVILSEERLGDSPGTHMQKAQSAFLLKGQLAPQRFPIGKVDVIRSAQVGQLRDYYRAFYRPERATMIVVGDIDLDTVEAAIKAHFGDWQGGGPAGPDPDLGSVMSRGVEAQQFVEAGLRPFVTVAWTTPYDGTPDSTAKEKRDGIEAIGFAILNERLARVAASADPPFLSAGAYRGNTSLSAKITTLNVNYQADGWRAALAKADEIRRQLLEQGPRQDEVDREVASFITGARAAVARVSTRQTPALAGALLASVDRDTVFSTPERDLGAVEADLKGLSAADVSAALRDAFVGNGPILFQASAKAIAGGSDALKQAFLQDEKAPVSQAQAPKLAEWPYTNFGTPGKIVEQRTIDDLGVTFVRFANGVRLTVKPTKFRADQILVSATVGAGRLALPPDRRTVVWADSTLIAGGLEAMDYLDMQRVLSTRIYGASFGLSDDGYDLSGSTRPADLDTQLQVLTAYLTAPGWRPEAFARAQTGFAMQLERADVTPSAVLDRNFSGLAHSGDARWLTPEVADVRAAHPEELKALLAPVLAHGPIEIVMVGDVTVDQAVRSVAATFGALPPRDAESVSAVKPGDVRFPGPTASPTVLYHSGRADQGLALIAWPNTEEVGDLQEMANRRLLMQIVQLRVTEKFRAEAGATYSPQAASQTSLVFPGYGFLEVLAETPPEKASLFFDTVAAIVADLRDHGPTADELERTREPSLSAIARNMEANGFWLGSLMGAQTDARKLGIIRTAASGIAHVSADDIRAAAAKYLLDARAWKLVIEPKQMQAKK